MAIVKDLNGSITFRFISPGLANWKELLDIEISNRPINGKDYFIISLTLKSKDVLELEERGVIVSKTASIAPTAEDTINPFINALLKEDKYNVDGVLRLLLNSFAFTENEWTIAEIKLDKR